VQPDVSQAGTGRALLWSVAFERSRARAARSTDSTDSTDIPVVAQLPALPCTGPAHPAPHVATHLGATDVGPVEHGELPEGSDVAGCARAGQR
jgi:hypothetical protein